MLSVGNEMLEPKAHLKCAKLPLISNFKCHDNHKVDLLGSDFCTLDKDGLDVCTVDIGAPMVCAELGANPYFVLAVTLAPLRNCKRGLSVYANVEKFVDWIEEQMGSNWKQFQGKGVNVVTDTGVLVKDCHFPVLFVVSLCIFWLR